MKKILLIVMLCLTSLCQAKTLEQVLKNINDKLNPKDTVHVGYEIEFRTENQASWINILTVMKSCRTDKFYVLRGGKLAEPIKNKCETHVPDVKNSLHQISCFTKPVAECKRLLAEQLTPELILEIVNKDLKDVEVE